MIFSTIPLKYLFVALHLQNPDILNVGISWIQSIPLLQSQGAGSH